MRAGQAPAIDIDLKPSIATALGNEIEAPANVAGVVLYGRRRCKAGFEGGEA
jgi:hypothetical protein